MREIRLPDGKTPMPIAFASSLSVPSFWPCAGPYRRQRLVPEGARCGTPPGVNEPVPKLAIENEVGRLRREYTLLLMLLHLASPAGGRKWRQPRRVTPPPARSARTTAHGTARAGEGGLKPRAHPRHERRRIVCSPWRRRCT